MAFFLFLNFDVCVLAGGLGGRGAGCSWDVMFFFSLSSSFSELSGHR